MKKIVARALIGIMITYSVSFAEQAVQTVKKQQKNIKTVSQDSQEADTSDIEMPSGMLKNLFPNNPISTFTDMLADSGIDVSLSFGSTYQVNVHGGVDTEDAQRGTGCYDFEMEFDLNKLLGIKGATIYALAEGGFGNGLDEAEKTGTLFGTNENAIGHRSVDLLELWYQQELFDGKLTIKIGKMDISGGFEANGCPVAFDCNCFANDETSQFMNGALVNNPTIPFPDYGLGIAIFYNPVDWFYCSAGIADAQADYRETGFNTAFHDESYFFYIFEFGFVPKFDILSSKNCKGAYRFGIWYDPQPKEKYFNDLGGRLAAKYRTDDVGFYISFDQMIYRENNEDEQGLAVFCRYGFAPGDVNEIEHFWSIGGQYKGLIKGRDEDVLGLGIAQGLISNELGYYRGEHPERETVVELYYNIKVAEWINVSPDIQYIFNPGGRGEDSGSDCLLLGIRVQMTF